MMGCIKTSAGEGRQGNCTVKWNITGHLQYNAARRVTFILISSKYSFYSVCALFSMCTVRVEWAGQNLRVKEEIVKIWPGLSWLRIRSGCRLVWTQRWMEILGRLKAVGIPITGLERPWGFQEVEAPGFQDNWHMKVARLSALHTGCLYPPGNIPGTHFC